MERTSLNAPLVNPPYGSADDPDLLNAIHATPPGIWRLPARPASPGPEQ